MNSFFNLALLIIDIKIHGDWGRSQEGLQWSQYDEME